MTTPQTPVDALTDEQINEIWSEKDQPLHKSALSPFGMERIRAIIASALAAMPASHVEAAAWMHHDDPRRVISAMQKADAVKDGGASASSVASYTAPLIHRHEGARQAGGVPTGWKMVPVNLTPRMRNAWDDSPCGEDDDVNMNRAYRAMLAAAPTPPVQPTVEQAIVQLVEALCESKGWMHAYADAIVRGVVDREAVQPLSEAQIEAIFHDVRHSNWKEAVRAILQAHGIVTHKEPT
jgi:hypothetical protein